MRGFALWTAFSFLALAPSVCAEGRQYAFLVACSQYRQNQFPKLPHTVTEAEDFRQALLATGFAADDIVFLNDNRIEDGGRLLPLADQIRDELELLAGRMTGEDTLVVLLNGHGLHFQGDKFSYFCPLNARAERKNTLVAMGGEGGVYEVVRNCKARRKLLLVNACRNDPEVLDQAGKKIRLDDKAAEEIPEGMAALFSCSPGQKCFYYPAAAKIDRSLFMNHLIESWKGTYPSTGRRTIEHVFRNVMEKSAADAAHYFGSEQIAIADRRYDKEWFIESANSKGLAALQRGKKLLREGRERDAEIAFTEAIRADAKFGEAYAYRAWVRNSLIQIDEASRDSENAIRFAPELAISWAARGSVRVDDPEAALADCEKAITLDPRSAFAYVAQSWAFGGKNDQAKAIAAALRAGELDPKSCIGLNAIGCHHNNAGRYDDGIAAFDKALRLAPAYAVAWNNRGWAYARKNEHERAVADFTKSIEADPRSTLANSNRAGSFEALEKFEEALADYDRAVEGSPSDPLNLTSRASFHAARGDAAKAEADHDKAIELAPKKAWVYVSRGQFLASRTLHERAIADFDRAVSLEPMDLFALFHRSASRRELGQLDPAIADLTKAIGIAPAEVELYKSRAALYLKRDAAGDAERAAADEEKAKELKK